MTATIPPLRVVVISQEDSFVIPANLQKVVALTGVQVAAVIVIDFKSSLANKKSYFLQGFGPAQSARMGAVLLAARFLNLLDAATGWRLLQRKRGLQAVARSCGIPFRVLRDVNSADSLSYVESLRPDLILSFSAPCVFKPALLAIPPRGCLNLHCSLLPKYAGVLPSFWVLFHGEKEAGATVHLMDDKIDNGGILGQVAVPVDAGMTMFQLIHRTKRAGGELVCDVLGLMGDGKTVPVRENHPEEGSYFGWPTVGQLREFRRACRFRLF